MIKLVDIEIECNTYVLEGRGIDLVFCVFVSDNQINSLHLTTD